jgi:outer membrane receptor protein involved in Fe transport
MSSTQKWIFVFLSFFVAGFLFPELPSARHDESGTQPREEDIEYLDYLLDLKVASGSFLDLDLEKSPFSMSVITREQIKISGARHMSELLEIFVPGFQYMLNRWNGTLWGMRGVANDRNTKIIYCVNGHKLNTQARDGFQGETTLGLFGDIERVEVLRGPAGLVYGSGAIAGIINVVTRKTSINNFELHTALSTPGTQEIDFSLFSSPAEDHTIAVSLGFKRSDGLREHSSRIYGSGDWPYPGNGGNTNGIPSDGSFGSTDGNWRFSGEWEGNNFNLYFRATRQKENTGGLFQLDPWPEKVSKPDSTSDTRKVDGKIVTWDDPFWSQTDAYRNNLLQFISDNIMAEGTWTIPLAENELKLNLGYDRNTTRTASEERPRYLGNYYIDETDFCLASFGESRLSAGSRFLLKSVPRLQLAAGLEYRFDMIGNDMSGINRYDQNPLIPSVTEINYNTFTLFSEGIYSFSDRVDLHAGGRLDFHTRAFMANPKLALLYRPKNQHCFKLILQSSSNNGSADNYEYNRFHYDRNGNLRDSAVFVTPETPPTENLSIYQPVPPEDSLHKLKPEKVYSIELDYTGLIGNNITLTPSVSAGHVRNIFGWSQLLYRVVNAGNYNYFNFDFDGQFQSKYLTVGMSHTYQRPFATDVDKQGHTYKIEVIDTSDVYYDSIAGYYTKDSLQASGSTYYYPITADEKADYEVNLVKETITSDGHDFLNLNTHVTKFYTTFMPVDWLALHMNMRLFWGLWGRHTIHNEERNFNYLKIADKPDLDNLEEYGIVEYLKKSVSKKLNLSLHLFLPKNFEISVFAYDILGIERPYDSSTRNFTINTIRWSYMFSSRMRELYSTDQQMFGIRIGKTF